MCMGSLMYMRAMAPAQAQHPSRAKWQERKIVDEYVFSLLSFTKFLVLSQTDILSSFIIISGWSPSEDLFNILWAKCKCKIISIHQYPHIFKLNNPPTDNFVVVFFFYWNADSLFRCGGELALNCNQNETAMNCSFFIVSSESFAVIELWGDQLMWNFRMRWTEAYRMV